MIHRKYYELKEKQDQFLNRKMKWTPNFTTVSTTDM